jgi:phosphatidate phosphatase PAH1
LILNHNFSHYLNYLYYYLGIYNHTHHGVVEFLNNLKSSCNCDILYLTSRPISHLKETKLLLRNTRDKKNSDKNKSNCLPLGPVFANTETLITAAYREIIAKNTVSLKSSILDTISDVFKQAALASVFPGFTGDPASVLPGFTGDPDYRTDFYFNPFLFGIGNKNADAVAYKRAGE